ncbi:MAG: LCP family protein [Anaerolineales bacterium]
MQKRNSTKNSKLRRHTPKFFEVITVIVFIFLVCLLGYILAAGLLAGPTINPAQAYALQTQKVLNATPTATPFLPVADADIPSIPNTSEENQNPDVPNNNNDEPAINVTPSPTNPTLKKPDGQVNILLLGSDVRPNDGGFRTDSIIWLSLNPKDGFVSAVSFPRDLYVEIPGMSYNRINVAFPRGGFDLLADTFETNFGVRPDHYILIDFNGFKTIINNLGGIDVYAEKNLSDSCATWIDPSGYCSMGPGQIHMNGDVALWYARSRYSSNDIERARRAQEVIKALFKRLMSIDAILRASELYETYIDYVQTDLNLSDLLPLLPLASKVNNTDDIRNYVIGFDQAYSWITAQGAQVLVPDNEAITQVLIDALELEY